MRVANAAADGSGSSFTTASSLQLAIDAGHNRRSDVEEQRNLLIKMAAEKRTLPITYIL